LEEPEWGSEDKNKLKGDSEVKGEKNDGGVRSSEEVGNQ